MTKLIIVISIFICNMLMQNTLMAQDGKPVWLLEKWIGDWKGNLTINNSSGKSSEVPMELSISQTETAGVFNWIIKYGEDGSVSRRDYLLRKIDSEKGIYVLDEQNHILIDFYNTFNTFYSTFSIEGDLIISKYQLTDNTIEFEIISSGMNVPNITNSIEKDSVLVYSYAIKVVQRASLIKN